MTSATIIRDGQVKRVTLSMEDKAKLLEVIDIHENGVLAVRSGSDPRIAYAVYFNDNFKVTSCACTGCKVHGRTQCAYRMAVQRRLDGMKRDYYCQIFGIYA